MWRVVGLMSVVACVCSMSCLRAVGPPVMLTNAGAQVRLGNAASTNCRELGVVNGENSDGSLRYFGTIADELAGAENDLRNRTAALGGNAVIVGPSTGRFLITVRGHALKCPDLPDVELSSVEPDRHAKALQFSAPHKNWPDM